MKKILYILLYLITGLLFAQEDEAKVPVGDSQHKIEQLIKNAQNETANPQSAKALAQSAYDLAKESGNLLQQLNALELIATNAFYLNELDVVLGSGNLGIRQSYEIGKPDKAAFFYNLNGAAYDEKEDYENALRNYFSALTANRECKNRQREAKNLYNIGLVYRVTGKYNLALQYLWESVKIKEQLKDKISAANSYNSLGNVYLQTGVYLKAEEVFNQALKIYQNGRDSAGLADVYGNLGMLYMQIDSLDKAEKFYLQAAEVDNLQKNTAGVAATANNLGLLYLKKNLLEEAEAAFLKSLTAEKILDHANGQAQVLINLSRLNMSKNRLFDAEKYALQAVALSNQADLLTSQNVYCTAGMLFLLKGNYQLGKEMLDKYDIMKDSLFSTTMAKEMAALRTRYENSEKEKQQFSVIRDKEINRLENQIFRYRLMIFLLVFIAGAVVTVRLFIKAQKKQKAKID